MKKDIKLYDEGQIDCPFLSLLKSIRKLNDTKKCETLGYVKIIKIINAIYDEHLKKKVKYYINSYNEEISGDKEEYCFQIAIELDDLFEQMLGRKKETSITRWHYDDFLLSLKYLHIENYNDDLFEEVMYLDLIDGIEELYNIDDEDIVTCEDCGALLRRENSEYVDAASGYVCGACLENNYTQCDHCYEYFRIGDVHEDINGNWYCDHCIDHGWGDFEDEYDEDDEDCDAINSYHETNNFRVLKSNKDTDDILTYGFELETEPSACDRYDFEECEDTNAEATRDFIAHRDNDGSLCDGVEFVSHAMSYNYIKEHKEDITKFLNALSELGYTSHNNGRCGLHFHIGTYNGRILDDETNAKIVLFIHENWEWFKKFSRRKCFDYCGNIHIQNSQYTKSYKSKIKEIVENKTYKNTSHYGFYIDYDRRTSTSELRIMRGTLNPKTFFATFYLVNAIVNVAKNNRKLTFSNIKSYLIKHNDYDIVKEYMNIRELTFEEPKQIGVSNNIEMEA